MLVELPHHMLTLIFNALEASWWMWLTIHCKPIFSGSMLLPNSSKYRDNDGLLEDPLLNKNEEDNDQDLDDDGNDGGSARDNGEILKEIAWYVRSVFVCAGSLLNFHNLLSAGSPTIDWLLGMPSSCSMYFG